MADQGRVRRRVTGGRCSGHWNGLRDKISSAKCRGDQGCAHLALNRVGGWCRRVDGVGPAAAHGRSSGSGRCWASPGSWILRIDAEQPCGSAAKVRKGWNLPAARKLGRRIKSPAVGLAQIQPLERRWSKLAGSGSFLTSGRRCRGGSQRLGCGRAVWPLRRNARGTAERNRAAALGFWAAAVDGNGAQEGPRAPNKGTPGSWACVPGAVKAEITVGCCSAGKADHANCSA